MTSELRVDAIQVGVGRTPNVVGLGLKQAGISYSRYGVIVDDRLRTSKPHVFAADDVASRFTFTHMANTLARIAIRDALFLGRAKASALTISWCTFTDPEVAHVGLYEHEAKEQDIPVRTFLQEPQSVDRAVLRRRAERLSQGPCLSRNRPHPRRNDRDAAREPGDLGTHRCDGGDRGLRDLARTIRPDPTQADAMKKAGDAYSRTRLAPFVQRRISCKPA